MPRTTVFAPLLATLLAFAASASAADVIYKVRLKDGTIEFTDKPPPDAVVLEKREGAPPPGLFPAPSKVDGSAVDERLRKREAEFNRKNAAVAAAERALAQARENLEKGREPHAGEMIGTARKGLVRQSPAYEERIRALEQAVVDAQAQLNKAIEARNAVR